MTVHKLAAWTAGMVVALSCLHFGWSTAASTIFGGIVSFLAVVLVKDAR